MDVLTFNSDEDMAAHLRAARDAAKAGLHSEQARLTYADCWVEFLDIGARLVVFGRVLTITEVRKGEDPDEVETIVAHTIADLEDGMMYGKAYSILEPRGELGYTHKANAWPIEGRLFGAALEANWDIDALDDTSKALLQIAYSAWKAHRLGSQ